MPVNPGGSEDNLDGAVDNEGPHCRNCHIGASSCQSCHGIQYGQPSWFFGASRDGAGTTADDHYTAWSTPRPPYDGPVPGYVIPDGGYVGGSGTEVMSGRLTSYMTQQYVHTLGAADINGKCIDGGFSYPHRTLGANLLKDELYGVDFDGTPIAAGDRRGMWNPENEAILAELDGDLKYTLVLEYASMLSEDSTTSVYVNQVGSTSLVDSATVQNLDSVCIDCHGDSTFWNGDDDRYALSYTNANGVQDSQGWDLFVKGLP